MKPWHILVASVSLLALGGLYYAISPLFITLTAKEEIPDASSTVSPIDDSNEEQKTSSSPILSEPAQVVGTLGHPASGVARIVDTGEVQYLRYENLKTINGPDLFVYLSKDLEAKEFIDLGRIRATEGNVNYEIPEGVDPSDYPYALIWCKAFSVLFNSAKLF